MLAKSIGAQGSGALGGIGVEAAIENDLVKVVAVIDGTPAALAGLKSGDLIIEINGALVQGLSLHQAVRIMRGALGENVSLTVRRAGGDQRLTLVRAKIGNRSDTLRDALQRAVNLAKEKRHAHADIEHLLFALLEDPHANPTLIACGADVDRLRSGVAQQIDRLPRLSIKCTEATPSSSVHRVLRRAGEQADAARRFEVNGDDVLVAILAESYRVIPNRKRRWWNWETPRRRPRPVVALLDESLFADHDTRSLFAGWQITRPQMLYSILYPSAIEAKPPEAETAPTDDPTEYTETESLYCFLAALCLIFLGSMLLTLMFSPWWFLLSVTLLYACVQQATYLRTKREPTRPFFFVTLGRTATRILYPLVQANERRYERALIKASDRWGKSKTSLFAAILREKRYQLSYRLAGTLGDGIITPEVTAAATAHAEAVGLNPGQSAIDRLWPLCSKLFLILAPLILHLISISYLISTRILRRDPTTWFPGQHPTEYVPNYYDVIYNESDPNDVNIKLQMADEKEEVLTVGQLLARAYTDPSVETFTFLIGIFDLIIPDRSEAYLRWLLSNTKEQAIGGMRFWGGVIFWLMKDQLEVDTSQVRSFHRQLVRYKFLEVDILTARNRAVRYAEETNKTIFKKIHPTLEERVSAATQRIDYTHPDTSLKAFRLMVRRYIAEGFLSMAIPREAATAAMTDHEWERSLGLSMNMALIDFFRLPTNDIEAFQSRNAIVSSDDHYVVFVVTGNGCFYYDLGVASKIDSLICSYVNLLGGIRDDAFGRAIGIARNTVTAESAQALVYGEKLSAIIFEPILAALNQVEQLIVCPDGMIARLPLEVLKLPNGRFLNEQYTVSYVESAKEIGRWANYTDLDSTSPCIVGSPDFDLGHISGKISPPSLLGRSEGPIGFLPLMGTEQEVRTIGRILGVAPIYGAEAVERKVKNTISPKILHIATHGVFLEADTFAIGAQRDRLWGLAHLDEPLARSCLALAGANAWLLGKNTYDDEDDGLLTAEDILEMNLDGTELVVLSACDTGLGDVRPGQGVFGLRRSLAIAGAQTIVMSLWKVPDEQTRLLMEKFYTHLVNGRGRAESLRLAKQEVRAVFPDPHHWGGFVCVGDVRPVSN